MSIIFAISRMAKVFLAKKHCQTFASSIADTAIARQTGDAKKELRPVSLDANDLGLVYTAGRSDGEP